MKRVLFLVVLMITQVALASDGFQQLKYGMTVKQVFKTQMCSFQHVDKELYQYMSHFMNDIKRYHQIFCEDFQINNNLFKMTLEFIDQKLYRILIANVDNSFINSAVLTELRNKYGAGEIQKRPKSKIYQFKDTTVEAEIYDPPNNSMYIRYTSPLYDKMLYGNLSGKF